jgi:hypothetical protein
VFECAVRRLYRGFNILRLGIGHGTYYIAGGGVRDLEASVACGIAPRRPDQQLLVASSEACVCHSSSLR